MEKDSFKTKNYEYLVDDEVIEVWKKKKLVTKSKISDFRVLYCDKVSQMRRSCQFIFITPTMEMSLVDLYKDAGSDRSIRLLLDKISQSCIMDLKPRISACFYSRSKQIKKLKLKERKEVKCTCAMCSNVWYISEDRLNKSEGNKMMAVGNLLSGNVMAASYNANNIGNPFECSKCGSSRITKQNIVFYTDKNGNHVEI